MKTCTKCGETKPLDDFGPEKRSKDGRQARCRKCHAIRSRNKRATDPVYVERQRQLKAARYEPVSKKLVDERFNEKWEEDENGCWIWQAYVDEDGYGTFWSGDKKVKAHRWSYACAYGSISDDNELHHTCGVRPCVNPEHLLEVTEEAHRELHRMSD